MSEIRRLVVGNTTEALIRVLFDNRIAQESSNTALNNIERAVKIRDLRSQIMAFIKRNANSIFELVATEYKKEKKVKVSFTNIDDDSYDLDEMTSYTILVDDNFVEANIIQNVKIGNNIVIKVKAYNG